MNFALCIVPAAAGFLFGRCASCLAWRAALFVRRLSTIANACLRVIEIPRPRFAWPPPLVFNISSCYGKTYSKGGIFVFVILLLKGESFCLRYSPFN